MPANQVFSDVSAFAEILRKPRAKRRGRVITDRNERVRGAALARADRDEVLRKLSVLAFARMGGSALRSG